MDCIHSCRLTLPRHTAFLWCTWSHHCFLFLLLPPAGHQVLHFHFLSLISLHPHCLRPLGGPSLLPKLTLPLQAILLNQQPERAEGCCKIRFNVADTVLPAVALLLPVFLLGPFSSLLYESSILFVCWLFDFTSHLHRFAPRCPCVNPHRRFLGTSYLLAAPRSSSLGVEHPTLGSCSWSPEWDVGVSSPVHST